ncbi:hypothetical protein D187_006777 [Cystobacter fuscus DSM 2262]|uniref:Uncharacterized protein n=1 Tax=Cystobacter fuscus (strain ATCC 25194 / DSM 2262 / NBRC 100088 / M29) TaxID=1242864 RepID=S9QKM1_CYSF2|nr:hypothetical protein [Cystobacter fuscus]EPX57023.1 hypothetical protein D187_006777 [Cystobacter fuscus DSM 2262]
MGVRLGEHLALGRGWMSPRVHMGLAPELPGVRLGHRHLVQVLLNLLLNAVDAVDAVESAQPARQAQIAVGARWLEGVVRLDVDGARFVLLLPVARECPSAVA